MSGIQRPPGPPSPFRIQLLDVSALVVGYGMAAVLFRAFWPIGGVTVALGLFAVGFYLWLGLAMSGPLLLLRHAPPPQAGSCGAPPARPPPTPTPPNSGPRPPATGGLWRAHSGRPLRDRYSSKLGSAHLGRAGLAAHRGLLDRHGTLHPALAAP